jgi:hypothetical protein
MGMVVHNDLSVVSGDGVLTLNADGWSLQEIVQAAGFSKTQAQALDREILAIGQTPTVATVQMHVSSGDAEGLLGRADLTVANGSTILVRAAELDITGNGTLTLASGKHIRTSGGAILITASDIDLQEHWDTGVYYGATIDSGSGEMSIYAAQFGQTVGLGDTAQDMHISDGELTRMLSTTSVSFGRFGGGAVVVESVSKKYSTRVDTIVFGDRFGDVLTSNIKQEGIPQVKTQAYTTVADFVSDPQGLPRLEASRMVTLGNNIVVTWYPDIYSDRTSHKYDWVGLYRKGDCDTNSGVSQGLLHKCYLAWKLTGEGLSSGQVTFNWAQYQVVGEYEARYFYGDSTDGQGYRCVTLTGILDVTVTCVLRARQTSDTITVGNTLAASSLASVPGLVEKVCDGSKNVCE